jgi:PilZ domain
MRFPPNNPKIVLGKNMAARHDLRRQNRQECTPTVKIMWCDSTGHDKFANAMALDISEMGMRLKVPEALPFQCRVTLRSEKLKLHGEASVRHCGRLGTSYSIGLEFARGIRWNAAAAAK